MATRNMNQYPLSNVYGKFVVFLVLWTNFIYSVSAKCSCYGYYGKLNTWQSGRTLCQQDNGDLVSIETLAEWEFIKDQIQKKTTVSDYNDWWIGLKYDRTKKQWKWLSNHSLVYDKWQSGKPSYIETGLRYHAWIAREWPKPHKGLFNNERGSWTKRGYICEYKFKEENNACTLNQKWCSPITTTSRPTTQERPQDTTSGHKTSASPIQTVTPTTLPQVVNTDPSSQPQKNKSDFPVYVIAIIIVILFVIFVVLIIFAYRLKKKRDQKPRNSHLSKDSPVPVKLDHNPSTNNLNDKIIYADVIKLDGHKIQINCDSQGVQKQKQTVMPCNTETVVYENLGNKNRNLGEETTDYTNETSWSKNSDKVKLINEMEEEKDEAATSLYDQAEQSKTEDFDESQNEKLNYVQIGDFKDLNPTSPPPKKPEPYTETDYAVIVKP